MSGLRIVVLGYIVRGPLGGLAWHHLQYVLGLARLGHDVRFVEDSDDYPSCYDPVRHTVDRDPSYGLKFADDAFTRLGISELWAYYDAHTNRWAGSAATSIIDFCRSADLLINVSGVNPLRSWLAQIPARALIDTDPAFTQIRNLTDQTALKLAREHTSFFTFGENFRSPSATIPDDGLPWLPTRQPIVLDEWRVTPGIAEGKFTSVVQWDSYKAREFSGRRYGMKSDSFAPYLDLPCRADERFELALGSANAPRELLREHGWSLCDPLDVTRDPWRYREFIQNSKAEFTVAKSGYVISRSGWFSERSAAYLASGRPVVTEDTGFTEWLPSGAGVFAFADSDQAIAAIKEVAARYDFHCRAARDVASEYFDARKVLPHLIARALDG